MSSKFDSLIESIFGAPVKRRVRELSDGGAIVYVTPPPEFGSESSVELSGDQYTRYNDWMILGGNIQERLPDLSPDDREILISGLS